MRSTPGTRAALRRTRRRTERGTGPRRALLTAAAVLGLGAGVVAGAGVAAATVTTPPAPPAAPSSGPAATPVAPPSAPPVVPPAPPVVPPAPAPPTPAALPTGIESLQPYVGATSCDPHDKAGPTRLGKLLVATYPGTRFGVSRSCGSDTISTSEHYEGRALDWMVSLRDPQGAAQAQAVLDWLLATDAAGNPYALARRLGVMYLIWDDRIWGAYAAGDGWRPYASCAAHQEAAWDTACHRNHIHISFGWNGAQARTSFWTGTVAVPDYGPCRTPGLNWAAPWTGPRATRCPGFTRVSAAPGASLLTATLTRFSGAQVGPGQTGPVVTAVQKAIGVTADGDFGPGTLTALHAFQAANAVPTGDAVDAATWRALLAVQIAEDAATSAAPPSPTPNATPTPTPGAV